MIELNEKMDGFVYHQILKINMSVNDAIKMYMDVNDLTEHDLKLHARKIIEINGKTTYFYKDDIICIVEGIPENHKNPLAEERLKEIISDLMSPLSLLTKEDIDEVLK